MSKKQDKINKVYEGITNSNFNLFDLVLTGKLSKCKFEDQELSVLFRSGRFNGHCQMGSLLCIIPLNDESKLIRGELLPDSTGPVFVHGWIETVFEGREYVVDVAMGRAIPKEEYYRKLRPRVDAVVTRKELSKNEYVQFLSKALYRENRLDLESVYTVWQPYEDDYLIDIDDNGMLIREQFEKPVQVRSRFIDQTEG